jgi:Protein of unknown function, DUF255
MDNPVAWQLWDSEAIALAKKFNRLIFVSIGYSACHCESFSYGIPVLGITALILNRVSRYGEGIIPVPGGGINSQ